MHEKHTASPPAPEWKEEILKDLNCLTQLPEQLVRRDPIIEVPTKTGSILRCETYRINLNECIKAGFEDILVSPRVGGERAFLVARDENNTIVGTRIASLLFEQIPFKGKGRILVKSSIKIFEKGKGFAWPVEQAFQQLLQHYADEKGIPFVWRIENDNLIQLEQYREDPNRDPLILVQKEEEQLRWQALYGEGGKIGIRGGRKVFLPKQS